MVSSAGAHVSSSSESDSRPARATRTRVGLAMSDMLGFVSYAANLRASLATDPSIDPRWMMIPPSTKDIWNHVPQFSMRMALRTASTLAKNRDSVDVLFVCTQVLALFSLHHMRRVPTIISLDATPACFDQIVDAYGAKPPGRVSGLIKQKWNSRIYSAAAKVIAWNEWTAKSLIADYGTPPENVKVLSPGINLELWAPNLDRAASGPVKLLFVGGDFERKGGRDLLTVYREAFAGRAEVDIVSNDPSVVAEPGVRVHRNLKANSDELRSLFTSANIFLLPSHGDANPWVVLEAMASGLPVISTRVGAIPEQAIHGETALLTERRDVRALREAIETLVNDPSKRRAFGAAGRARAETLFDARTNDRLLFDVFHDVARDAKERPRAH